MSDYATSLARCIEYSAGLRADDYRFNQEVELLHEDGSFFYLRCAFTMLDPEDPSWLWVITEHFGEFVHDLSDIEASNTFQMGRALQYTRTAR